MNRTFKNVAFFFFVGFGVFYLTSDFLIHQSGSDSDTLRLIYDTFDMPFFFSAGMYALAAGHQTLKKRYDVPVLGPLFWALAIAWTFFLIYVNLGYESFL